MRVILNWKNNMPFKSILLGSCLLLLTGCSPSGSGGEETKTVKDNGVVNIYSSRHYDTDLRLYSDFTERTGIKVNRIEAKSNALIERLKTEGELSPADLLVTVDAGVFWRAENEGILQPVSSDVLEAKIPAHLRHPDGLWYGLSKRARLIIYNKAAGRPEDVEDYDDMAAPNYKGKVCMRSSGNIYNISLLSSIISNAGEQAATDWAQSMVDNFARKPQSNDTGQIEAVASGICELSLVNSYYLARFAKSNDPEKQKIYSSIGVIFPNQDNRGTHINISGAAVTAHAPNKENAIAFMEYLTSEQAQKYFADGNNEYPVIDQIEATSALKSLGGFKEDKLNVGELGKNQAKAINIYNKVGWQ